MATKVLLGGKLMFPSDYVAAVEFKGRDVRLTIAGVQQENLAIRGGKKERKPVLTFRETKKKLVLNKTNAGTIAEQHGTNAEEWVGKQIVLYPTRVQCGRETVDAVRVRESNNGRAAIAPEFNDPEPHDEELPEDDAFAPVIGPGEQGDAAEQNQPTSQIPPTPANGSAGGSSAGSALGINADASEEEFLFWACQRFNTPEAAMRAHMKLNIKTGTWKDASKNARQQVLDKIQKNEWPVPKQEPAK